MAYDEVSEDSVYLCVGHPARRDIENIVKWMLNDHFSDAYNSILCHSDCTFNGVSLSYDFMSNCTWRRIMSFMCIYFYVKSHVVMYSVHTIDRNEVCVLVSHMCGIVRSTCVSQDKFSVF